ncbi:DUF4817 domain-containing protein [Trichonephila clavipes]|nr:DUF4817 domain-containing protein [Trichonephila clavipes]
MDEAEIYLMKQVQLSSFYTEIRAMQNGDDICNKKLEIAISHQKNSSPGHDKISLQSINHLPIKAINPLLKSFNDSWSSSQIPKDWTHAIILPFIKPHKNPKEVSSYRPISLTSVIAKLLERMILKSVFFQFGLAIHQNDHQARRRFVEWAQNEIAIVPDFHKRILFSDEAHFWLNGYVNKQNCRIWSEANPQVYVETPLNPEKLTVWCTLWAGGIIGPYFFKNDEGHNVTVNDDRYRAMFTNFFIPELNNHDVQELWFQQDGATCHTARATIDLLKDTFGDRLSSRFGPENWPPRSCDLTPLDYFLWAM